MTFGEALEAAYEGKLITRDEDVDWFVFVVIPEDQEEGMINTSFDGHGSYEWEPFLAIKTSWDTITPWVPSQTDMITDDWIALDVDED